MRCKWSENGARCIKDATNATETLCNGPCMFEEQGDVTIYPDDVNHPVHYMAPNGIEVIDVIEAFDLGFRLDNCIKYILRADKKGNRLQDLKKAQWYLNREIDKS